MKDSSEVRLLKGPSSYRFNTRIRNGIYTLLFATIFLVILTIYLCSFDYERIRFERRLVHLQQAILESSSGLENATGIHKHDDANTSAALNKRKVNSKFSDWFVPPHLWNTDHDHDIVPMTKELNHNDHLKFDMTSNDVIVFMEIQNTGSNIFGRHLVEDLILDRPCNCHGKRKCQCFRPNKDNSYWLFSRWTVGWKCGVHSDFTELIYCVDNALDDIEGEAIKRRYFYITLLRDPVKRFLSEYYRFKQLGSGSGGSQRRWCRGREVQHVPKCNSSSIISIYDYMSCSVNLAINRQTRMLSDLGLVNCYNYSFMPKEERDLIMLTSAKNNLHKLAFFGLTEYPRISQKLFEEIFDIMFLDADTHSFMRQKRSILDDIDGDIIDMIKKTNHLDMKLYEYAKGLLFDRFDRLKNKNPKLKEYAINHRFESKSRLKDDAVNWGDKEDSVHGIN